VITFCPVDPDGWSDAYAWHCQFVKTNDFVFPRTIEQFKALASTGQIFCAREKGKYLGLVYFKKDESLCTNDVAWEIGGLMVDPSYEGLGIGKTLVSLALGYVLFEESPLQDGMPVLAHVHSANAPGPRPIFAGLKFKRKGPVEVDGRYLPGLRVNEKGMVTGDELWITMPDTLKALAAWCRSWPGKLKSGQPAEIIVRDDLGTWATAFEHLAD
jgi:GNAT superfamily N-acetyltransferase